MSKYFYQPVKPFYITQSFGAKQACISTDGSNITINCDGNNPPAGFKSLYGPGGHNGTDLMSKHGQEVYCALSGYIESIDTNPKTGLDVRVVSEIDGHTYRHIYEHLLGYQGKVKDYVITGQLIGWADNTGYSSRDHLHFGLYEKNNLKWKAIDPMPLMHPIFARDHLKTIDGKLWAIELLSRIADNLAYRLRQIGK